MTDSSYRNAQSLYRQVHIFTLSWLICHRAKKETQKKGLGRGRGGPLFQDSLRVATHWQTRSSRPWWPWRWSPGAPEGPSCAEGWQLLFPLGWDREKERARESIERVLPRFLSPLHTRADRVLTGQDFWMQTNKYIQSLGKEHSVLWFYVAGHKSHHQLLKFDNQSSDNRLHRFFYVLLFI